jgi:hypothetical protein
VAAELAGAECAMKRAVPCRRFVRPLKSDWLGTLCLQNREPRNIPGPNSNSSAWPNWMRPAAIDYCNIDYLGPGKRNGLFAATLHQAFHRALSETERQC